MGSSDGQPIVQLVYGHFVVFSDREHISLPLSGKQRIETCSFASTESIPTTIVVSNLGDLCL